MKKRISFNLLLLFIVFKGSAQVLTHADSITILKADSLLHAINADTSLRIININPTFNVHVDSMLAYQFLINRETSRYYWYLKNSPVGLKIDKDNGLLTFRPDKSYFLSGKLKYDYDYKVTVGVQNLSNPKDKYDTSFTLTFYNTEILPSKVKPSVSGTLVVYEGDPVSFKVQCEAGSFPIEDILFSSSISIKNFTLVKKCDDEFNWTPGYDFVNPDTDADQQKSVNLIFIGSTKFKVRDTAVVKIIVKNAQRNEVPLLLSTSNHSIFFIKACYSKQSSSPTKHGEIMAMGIPVVTNSGVGDVAEIVEKYQSGIVIKNLDKINYDSYAEKLCTTNYDAKRIRAGAQAFYSLENAIQKYLKVYNHILGEKIIVD